MRDQLQIADQIIDKQRELIQIYQKENLEKDKIIQGLLAACEAQKVAMAVLQSELKYVRSNVDNM